MTTQIREMRKGWLGKAIEAAQADIKTWPEWMQRAAKFEGTPFGSDEVLTHPTEEHQ
jgi:hypothetical protein